MCSHNRSLKQQVLDCFPEAPAAEDQAWSEASHQDEGWGTNFHPSQSREVSRHQKQNSTNLNRTHHTPV
jgi:hypothetical protein